jgi:hypothetical protein
MARGQARRKGGRQGGPLTNSLLVALPKLDGMIARTTSVRHNQYSKNEFSEKCQYSKNEFSKK